MKPFFRFFFAIAIAFFCLTSCSKDASTEKTTQSNSHVLQVTLPEMISQYNAAMTNYSQKLLLPSSASFTKTTFPHNKFYDLKYSARRNMNVEIEIDSATNFPISIGTTVAGYSADDLKDFFAQTMAIGHAVFKDTKETRMLFDMCGEMLSQKLPMRIAIQGNYMFSCVREDNILSARIGIHDPSTFKK